MRLRLVKGLIISAGFASLLSACGGGGSGATDTGSIPEAGATLSGVFLDAPVKGLYYTSMPSGRSGVTDSEGRFDYVAGDTVSFTLGKGAPVSLGDAGAKSEVRVTEMSNFVEVAVLLQTLDTNPDSKIIDVEQIELPSAIQTQLDTLLQQGEDTTNRIDIQSILTDENIALIQSTSQPAEGSGEPPVELVNTSVVSINDAVEHLSDNIVDDFTVSDISGQVLKSGWDLYKYFKSDGTGIEYWPTYYPEEPDDDSTYAKFAGSMAFTWSLNESNELEITYSDGYAFVMDLLSQEGSKFAVSVNMLGKPDDVWTKELYGMQPLGVDSLNGKIIRLTNSESGCAAQTMKFSGTQVDVKESCSDGVNQYVATVSTSPDFQNMLVISGTDPRSEAFSLQLSLIDGSVSDDSPMKFIALNKFSSGGVTLDKLTYEVTDEELDVSNTFTSTAVSGQVYIHEETKSLLNFKEGGYGNFYTNSDELEDSNFNWDIDPNGQLYIRYGDYSKFSLTASMSGVAGNLVTTNLAVDGETDRAETFHQALPLSPSDLDGKIWSLDTSNLPDCSAWTIKFEGGVATSSMQCLDGYDVYIGSLSAWGSSAVAIHGAGLFGSIERGSTSIFSIYQGDLDGEAKVVFTHFDESTTDILEPPGFFNVTLVEEALSAPGFIESDFAKQVYSDPATGALLFFNDDGTGKEAKSDEEFSLFSWSINNQNQLILDWSSTTDDVMPKVDGEVVEAWSRLDVSGNEVTIVKDDSTQRVLLKALPLSRESIQGKIISFADSKLDAACTQSTMAFDFSTARHSTNCGEEQILFTSFLNMHPDFDNVLIMSTTQGDELYFALTGGSFESSGTFALMTLSGSVVGSLTGAQSFVLTDEEAVPEGTGDSSDEDDENEDDDVMPSLLP